ncbi:uncharacterized protein HD556DRAFT_1440910 [Suillus plorans]|uniref:Uncharacterized protein n=1 Tax=Suillus plorans TaxID=116603 RepID=A0A9P7DKV0_9AGAM|nr:uncharacterized protein HD556DRAFT_1440910 [Suillus plorans]KAG1797352.1 hypothetical protein HD556DRAFT_1440910 [Suillus plorans]
MPRHSTGTIRPSSSTQHLLSSPTAEVYCHTSTAPSHTLRAPSHIPRTLLYIRHTLSHLSDLHPLIHRTHPLVHPAHPSHGSNPPSRTSSARSHDPSILVQARAMLIRVVAHRLQTFATFPMRRTPCANAQRVPANLPVPPLLLLVPSTYVRVTSAFTDVCWTYVLSTGGDTYGTHG